MDGLEQVKQEVDALAVMVGELAKRFEQHAAKTAGQAHPEAPAQ